MHGTCIKIHFVFQFKWQNKIYSVQIYGNNSSASGFVGAKVGVLKMIENINCGCYKTVCWWRYL